MLSSKQLLGYINYVCCILFVVMIPWDPYFVNSIGAPFRLTLFLFPVTLLFLAVTIIQSSRVIHSKMWLSLFFLSFISMLSLLKSVSLSTSVSEFAAVIIIFFQAISFAWITNAERVKTILLAYIFSFSVLAIYTLFEPSYWRGIRLIPIEGYNPSWFGAFAIASIFAALLVKKNFGFAWLPFLLSISLGVVIVMLSQSRNAVVSFLVAFILVGIHRLCLKIAGFRFFLSKDILYKMVALVFSAIVMMSAFVLFVDVVGFADFSRFQLVTSGNAYEATAGRTGIWSDLITSLINRSVMFGVGVGNSNYYLGITPHNQYLRSLYELGVFGLVATLYIFWNIASIVRRASAHHRGILSAAAIYLAVLSFGNDGFGYSYFWIVFVFIVVSANLRSEH